MAATYRRPRYGPPAWAHDGRVRVVAAPDKFRGTATAAARSPRRSATRRRAAGWDVRRGADGRRRRGHPRGARRAEPARPRSPGRSARRSRRRGGSTAARRSSRWPGRRGSSWSAAPRATTRSPRRPPAPGELIVEALDDGARRVIVGLGGSATTDGGLAALRALHPLGRLKGVELVVACDAACRFLDAAAVVRAAEGRHARPGRAAAAPARAAGPGVPRGARRRRARRSPGAGAAGGLAGGLAAVGARAGERLRPRRRRARPRRARSRGPTSSSPARASSTSSASTARWSAASPAWPRSSACPVVAVAGEVFDGVGDRIEAVSLVERFGEERARGRHARRASRRSPPDVLAGHEA